MSTNLTQANNSIAVKSYDRDHWSFTKGIAQTICASKKINVGQKEVADIMLQLQTGYEMGMTPMQAMHDLYVVQGRVCTFAEGTIRRLREAGWWIEYLEEDDEHIKAEFSRDDKKFTEVFTLQDAIDSGYTKNAIAWTKGAKRKMKLRYSVVQKAIKSRIPEVLGVAGEIVELVQDSNTDSFPKDEESIERAETMENLSNKAVKASTPEEIKRALDAGESVELENGDIIH